MPIMRAKGKDGKDVIWQKKRLLMPSWLREISWKNYTTASSEVHSIENEISRHCKEILRLLEQFETASNRLAAEVKAASGDKWGNGKPFDMPYKEFAKMKIDVPVPTYAWKQVLSRTVLRMYHIDSVSSNGVRGNEAKRKVSEGQKKASQAGNEGGSITAYTLDNLESQGVGAADLEADTAVQFKEPQQQKSQKNRGKQQQNNNQRNNQQNRNGG